MNKKESIYLDYAATTPIDPRVKEKMLPYFDQNFGNPSSIHRFGQLAEAAIEDARNTIAGNLNCLPDEIIFTSGGSESDNLALRGVALAMKRKKGANHILTTPVEHHAVTQTAKQLTKLYDFELEYLPVDCFGMVDPADVRARIKPSTAIVSIIYGNNEIGTINPVDTIALICKEACVPFHTDAVQAAGYCKIDLKNTLVDLLSIGAHKFYGPKGIGALFVRTGTPILPIQTGGSQEFSLRAGTHNVPYILGMAEAHKFAYLENLERQEKLIQFRDKIITVVLEEIEDVYLTGHTQLRLPNHASFAFRNVDGNLLTILLDSAGYACSSGSACKTGNSEPSEVLLALGLAPDVAMGSLRITVGLNTTMQNIEDFLRDLPSIISKARK